MPFSTFFLLLFLLSFFRDNLDYIFGWLFTLYIYTINTFFCSLLGSMNFYIERFQKIK